MAQEVADPNYCYTFDEDSSIEEYWESSLTEEDLSYVKAFAESFFEDLIGDIADSDEEANMLRDECDEQKNALH